MTDTHEAWTPSSNEPRWYAVHTRAKHEKHIGELLVNKGVQAFVPTLRHIRRWSDRSKAVELPLFSCYVFVHDAVLSAHMRVLQTPGVLRWVGANGEPTAIPDSQIEAIRSLVEKNAPLWPHEFLKVGQRVRIRGGSLDGVEGTLVAKKGERRLVISIDLIQQSLATTIDGYDIEPV